tara:strand:- start:221 stop:445 length:225 start_codon:yes stop_codon:yes gene_type:complete
MRWMLILIVIGLVLSAASIPSWNVGTVKAETPIEFPAAEIVESDIDCLIAPQYPDGSVCVETITFADMEIVGSI